MLLHFRPPIAREGLLFLGQECEPALPSELRLTLNYALLDCFLCADSNKPISTYCSKFVQTESDSAMVITTQLDIEIYILR